MTWPTISVFLMGWIAFAAWVCLTFGPIAMAFGSWSVATRMRHGWIAHILFLPVVLGLEWFLILLMFWGARDDGEGPPGLGLAMIPAIGVLVVTVAIYYGALALIGAAAGMKMIRAARRGAVR